MKEGWLCDSTLKAAHQPSPTSTIPAFSPGGTMTRSPPVGSLLRCVREDLYEQCSDHMTEKTPSSTNVGSRPRSSLMRSYSSGLRLCAATTSGVIASEFISGNGGPVIKNPAVRRTAQDKGSRRFLQTRRRLTRRKPGRLINRERVRVCRVYRLGGPLRGDEFRADFNGGRQVQRVHSAESVKAGEVVGG